MADLHMKDVHSPRPFRAPRWGRGDPNEAINDLDNVQDSLDAPLDRGAWLHLVNPSKLACHVPSSLSCERMA